MCRKEISTGHVASLVWKKGWKKGNPFVLPIKELDTMRTKAAVLFPQGIMGTHITTLCDRTDGKFGPFAGQLFIGEMNRERIVRVMLETVDGALQGPVFHLLMAWDCGWE